MIRTKLLCRHNSNIPQYKCSKCHQEYYDKKSKQKKCSICSKLFNRRCSFSKFCSRECSSKYLAKVRIGKKNPAYRNGVYSGKQIPGSVRKNGKHEVACRKYRKSFLEKHEYLFCEQCGINNSPRFETHHIYFASLFPRHKELHNSRNLILVCIGCHNNFHSSVYKNEFLKLEKDRGLKELFANKEIFK